MTSLVVMLVVLSAMFISTSSMRRQGRMTARQQAAFMGVFVVATLVVAALVWANRPAP